MKNIVISADRTCDLSEELMTRYGVETIPYHIILEGKEYLDNVTITADDLYNAYWERKQLPKTSAISMGEYMDYFKHFTDEGKVVVHINLGSGLSVSNTNALLAAKEIGEDKVFVVDSKSLSTGTGLLVIDACLKRDAGLSAAEIAKQVSGAAHRSHASFILDTLEFMAAGGRCSNVVALGANLLKLRPCIEVVSEEDGKMRVGKKYRGEFGSVLASYVNDTLSKYDNIDTSRIFITHAGIDPKHIETVRAAIESRMKFDEILVTRAACTISSHCGPCTLGILFMTK